MKKMLMKLFGFKKAAPRKPRLAVIDDCGFIVRGIERDFAETHDVDVFYRIPDDLHELDKYDVLIVDGDGIGNTKFMNGVDFIREYETFHKDKKIIHYTGLCTQQNRTELESRGVKVVSKGGWPSELIEAVNGKGVKTK